MDKKTTPVFIAAALLLVLCLLTYGDILHHQFMIDDISYHVWVHSFYSKAIFFFTKTHNHHYQPFYNIMNVALFHLFHNPFPLYLINLILIYTNCLLLFILLFMITGDFLMALLTVAIFCVHPMTAEIVEHITFNNVLCAAILMKIGLIMLYQFLTKNNVWFYIISIIVFFAALLFLETSHMFIIYAGLMVFILGKRSAGQTIKICLPYFLESILFIALWFFVASPHAPVFRNIHAFQLTLPVFSANFFHLVFWYIGNLFVPREIVLMYNVAPVTNVWLWNLYGLIFCAGLAAVVSYFRKSLESFGLLVFIAGFLMAIPGIASRPNFGFIFEPYWLFFSSIGLYFFVVLLLFKFRARINRPSFILIPTAICVALFIQTQRLNVISRNQFSYCLNWTAKSPGNPLALELLARCYISAPDIKISPKQIPDMLNMVNVFIENHEYETSLTLITRLFASNLSQPQKQGLYGKLAAAYYKLGRIQPSRTIIQNALIKSDPSSYIQMSQSLYDLKGTEEITLEVLDQCLLKYPNYKEAYLFKGVILANQKHYKKSIDVWTQGLKIDPTDTRFKDNIDRAQKFKQE